MKIGLSGIGLLYVTAISVHSLSYVVPNDPSGVVNVGNASPDMRMLNVLSFTLPKLSVTLITKVLVVSEGTMLGIPNISPSLLNDNPSGKEPLINAYVNEVAGSIASASNCKVIAICTG